MNTALEEQPLVSPSGTQLAPTKEELKTFRASLDSKDIPVRKIVRSKRPPDNLLFGIIREPSLRLFKAIPLSIERKRKSVIARWIEIDEFGYGRNLSEAAEDFAKTVTELYLTLMDKQEHLSEDLKQVWTTLNQHIGRRDTR